MNILTLKMFTKTTENYLKYSLNINKYRICIYQCFGKYPFNINFTYPSGYSGEKTGFLTPQEAIDYLNKKKWWNFTEPKN